MKEAIIVAAGRKDYEKLIAVWESSVRATHHFLSENDIMTYRSLILTEYFDQVRLYAVKYEEEVMGFIGINKKSIQMLFIHPDARGKGLGKTLIDFAKDEHDVNTVDVNEQNEQAVGFYEKLGFVTYERSERDGAGKPFPVLSMALQK
ncbi:GNAT family N-acetyltransferase [Pedobacter alluvionis]|uniref:GNAT family N-acetyltransferase n=1 Tax=Pedobacter alluvionis TaxID=475253 RepID=A0A497Y7W6_9SPHI|nr:GNAT family N-acetyltransferase [Pedobacter alluvionis]RLJ79672.1 putative acetyltransferase [Pedobacter alluvionis]TFB30998.1 GNAT family N-acetyltransferase [Pedobacter alluvionis]